MVRWVYALFFLLSFSVSSQSLDTLIKPFVFQKKGYILPYRLFVPAGDSTTYPLILFLHGAGERGKDNKAQLTHSHYFFRPEIMQNHPFIFLAPQCPPNERWVEVSWKLVSHTMPSEPSNVLKAVFDLLDSLIKVLPVDTHRIYVTGLSMGGFGTWDALCRRPDFFAAAMPVCGGGDENKACLLKNIPIKAFHGSDDKVVIPARTMNMVNAIRGCGGILAEFIIYDGVGHDSWKYAFGDINNIFWLLQQRKP
ncbi:MAG: prolyl oligopeptidase family serine peptidase [Bacteroidales bacterium]|nr:prolyl oligopeptidase family serine peptidase [Bacteroidales bacterium]